MAPNLNQIEKKRNGTDELNALERADLNSLSLQVKQLAVDIKKIAGMIGKIMTGKSFGGWLQYGLYDKFADEKKNDW